MKKNGFFGSSLSHIPRWVCLVQKTQAKNSHAWASKKYQYTNKRIKGAANWKNCRLLCLVWVSWQASLHSSLKYCIGVLHLGVEKWCRASESAGQVSLPVTCQAVGLPNSAVASGKWLCQASDSARNMQSCERYAARQTDMIMWSRQPHAHTSRRGHHCRKTWPQGLSTFSQCTEFLPHRGCELMSFRSGVRRSNWNG
jgi:hypothetical protein